MLDQTHAEAAQIMRELRPKDMGQFFDAARFRFISGQTPDLAGEGCENAHGWAVVDAHYQSLRDPAYRQAAGMTPQPI